MRVPVAVPRSRRGRRCVLSVTPIVAAADAGGVAGTTSTLCAPATEAPANNPAIVPSNTSCVPKLLDFIDFFMRTSTGGDSEASVPATGGPPFEVSVYEHVGTPRGSGSLHVLLVPSVVMTKVLQPSQTHRTSVPRAA